MAIYQYTTGEDNRPKAAATTTNTNHPILSTVAGLSLLALAGFTLFLSLIVLLLSLPLLIFFSPLLLLAGSVLAGLLFGFGFATATGYAGFRSVKWVLKSMKWGGGGGGGGGGMGGKDEIRVVDEMMTESGQKVKVVEDLGGSRRGVTVYPPENLATSK